MLLQGLVIMVVGVVMVVGFLSLLVAVLTLSAKIIPRFNHILPDEEPRVRTRKPGTGHAAKQDASNDNEIAVAIAAAAAHQRDRA
jgi:sodium pump decarboxylase gamma subunit